VRRAVASLLLLPRPATMYNGIGLTSVRGSGTSGYVQKNMAHVSRQRQARAKAVDKKPDLGHDLKDRRANTEILEHNRKREVEVKVMRLRVTLEDQKVPDADIDAKCDKLRADLLARLPPPREGGAGSSAGGRAGETHTDAASKANENAALKEALGISSSYVGGAAFDRELQAQKKAERMAKREAEEEAKRAAEAELEREAEREEKRRRKEDRRAEKEREKEERKKRRREDRDD